MKIMILLAVLDLEALSVGAEQVALLSLVMSLVILIVFFYMAVNISKIRRSLNPASSYVCFDRAEKYEFMRENKKALEMYLEGIYLEARMNIADQAQMDNREKSLQKEFEAKITALGGKWPDFKALNL